MEHPIRTARIINNKITRSVREIINDTPATRAIILALADPEIKKLCNTSDCTNRAALIASLCFFWT